MERKSEFIEWEGVKLHVSIQGEGETVLLLHGGYSNLAVWDEVAELLAQQYRVIRFDQRGYGQSSPPAGPFSYYEDIKKLLDWYQITETSIIGSSFGGAAAIDFTLQFPQYVKKLILVAPSIHGLKYPFRMTWAGILDYLRVKRFGIEKASEVFMSKAFWSYLIPKDEQKRQLFRRLYISNEVFYTSSPSLQKPLQPFALQRLAELEAPTLVIEADRDHPFNKQACDLLHQRVKGAAKFVIPNSGHYPHLEHPSQVSSVALQFLQST
ncbi:alpha/beta fold hydrolase [Paenibacillus turpanensis]|uniref:alpha/beta fold hydrolase n=1 Tax=Paenibacillus turpanensis TaxID=2689078 RepID=UPI00140A3989|nr:alpha/beta hydrolase [Paenibacillus turpanensis]